MDTIDRPLFARTLTLFTDGAGRVGISPLFLVDQSLLEFWPMRHTLAPVYLTLLLHF